MVDVCRDNNLRTCLVMGTVFLLILNLISCVQPSTLPPSQVEPSKPAKIALVLGAGAARGFAHIGVLKVLESHKIPIHMLVGTSAGSFVGSFYAYGYNAYQLQTMSFEIERDDVFDLIFPDNGFVRGDKLENYVNKKLNNTPIEKLKIPLYIVATNIQTGEEIAFGKGNTGMAVRASCSIPGIFQPAIISGSTYVDGGVVSPVAVNTAKKHGADIVIAVDISTGINKMPPQSTIDTILQSIDIMYARMSEIQVHNADVTIRPKVAHIRSADFTKRHETILEGEKAAIEALPLINQIITKLKEEGRLPL